MRHSKGELREREQRQPKLTRYKVYLQQYVENTAMVEIEAATPEDAIDQALFANFGEHVINAVWTPGDDAYDADVYMVKDMDDNEVWERT